MALFLNEYEKLRLVGKGAFASIWKVRHHELGYIRAIKVSNEVVDSETDKAYQTFLKECRVLLKIGNGCHPNIVHIYRPRLIDNKAIVEMDYVEGVTLTKYLEQVRFMPFDEVHRLITEIGGALAYCHHDIYRFLMTPDEDNLRHDPDDASRFIISDEKRRQLVAKYGVTHNDIHSSNVMRRDYDGMFVLLDFGLAIQNDTAVKSSSRRDGALEYRAPEKWDNDSVVTTQSDVYSMGVLLYEALAGQVPFVYDPSKYTNELQGQNEMYHLHHDVTPPGIEPLRMAAFKATHPGEAWIPDYPAWLEEMIMKCLAKRPEDRYADAREFMDDYIAHRNADALVDQLEKEEAEKVPGAEEYQAAIDEVLDDLSRSKEHAQQLEVKNSQLQSQITTLNSNIATLVNENNTLKRNLQEKESTVGELRGQLATSPKTIVDGKRKTPWAWMVATLLCAVAAVGLLYAEHRGTPVFNNAEPITSTVHDTVYVTDRVKTDQMVKGYQQQQKQLAAAQQEIDSLKNALAAASTSGSADNSGEVARLQKQLAQAESEKSALKKDVANLKTQNATLKSQNANLTKSNNDTEAKLQRAMETLKKRTN